MSEQRRIAFYVNRVANGWDPRDGKTWGGSEEGVVELAKLLASSGWKVELYANTENLGTSGDGDFSVYHHDDWKPQKKRDVVVSVKEPMLFDRKINAKCKILWTTDPLQPTDMTPGRMRNIDRIVCLTNWHRDEVLERNKHIPAEQVVAIPYGAQEVFDTFHFSPGKTHAEMVLRDPKLCVYASSFDRGLEVILARWPKILEEVPDAKLHIWHGWEPSDRIHGNAPRYLAWKQKVNEAMGQDGITLMPRTEIDDPTPYLEAGLWLYPCMGGERYCLTAVKAQACGAVPVVVPTMALDETVQFGRKEPNVDDWQQVTVDLLKDADAQETLRAEMLEKYETPRWPAVLEKHWEPIWNPILDAEPEPEVELTMSKPYPLDIFMCVPGLPFQGDTLETKDLGGSETAALCTAEALGEMGHKVTVFSECEKPGPYGKVLYQPLNLWERLAATNPHDVSIIQRTVQPFLRPLASKLHWMWVHDLGLRPQSQDLWSIVWNLDKILAVSEWHREQYSSGMGITKDRIYATRNGLRLDKLPTPKPLAERDRNTIVYAARPERGLDRLLQDIMPRLLKANPEIKLKIFAYDNVTEQMRGYYQSLMQKAKEFGDSVEWVGSLTQAKLHEVYASAGAYVYPTPGYASPQFREVSCISAMESMACGLPFISSALGALPETLHPEAGVLIGGHTDPTYDDRFAKAVLDVLSDDGKWSAMSAAGIAHAKGLGWAGVAKDWTDLAYRQIAERNQNPASRARYFAKRSDIVAAREAISVVTDDEDREDLSARIEKSWGPILGTDEDRAKEYAKIAGGIIWDVNDPRLKFLCKSLDEAKDIQKVYLCGYRIEGLGTLLGNSVSKEFVEVDLAKGASFPPAKLDGCVLVQAIERVPDPERLLGKVEQAVKDKGAVWTLTPFGPWEQASFDLTPYRQQLWEFCLADLRDMFGGKADLRVQTLAGGVSSVTSDAVGWRLSRFRNSGGACRPVKMDRKQELQAPRQSVSALIIAGTHPNQPTPEETLRWCLKPLAPIMDEILVGNCGGTLSEEAKAICLSYERTLTRVKVIDVSNPTSDGFEAPRNELLTRSKCEWIHWIDTDERLLNPQNVPKFLRHNLLDAYPVRQHHFSTDSNFPVDIPARFFRDVANDGRSCRWFGMVHEHPEKSLNEGPGAILGMGDVDIVHIGYLREEIRKERFKRNNPLLAMDMAKYPDRWLQKYFIMRDNMLAVAYMLKNNGNNVTPQIAGMCQQAITVWREHLKGKPVNHSADPVEWMSQALQVLKRGFPVRFGFASNRFQMNGQGPSIKNIYFENTEDANAELSARIQRDMADYDKEWWGVGA